MSFACLFASFCFVHSHAPVIVCIYLFLLDFVGLFVVCLRLTGIFVTWDGLLSHLFSCVLGFASTFILLACVSSFKKSSSLFRVRFNYYLYNYTPLQ